MIITADKEGFSILEITVSIFIISMAFIALLSLTNQNIQAQKTSENYLIASQLAQEGLELVRNIRDNNWGSGNFYDNIYDAGDNTFTIDYRNLGPDRTAISIDDTVARLYINSAGYYDHDNSGGATPFYRLITVATTDISKYLEIECKIKWSERGRDNEYTASTMLYDWR